MRLKHLMIALSLYPIQADAANFCDSVIVNRAFNTTSTEQQSTIYNKMRAEMCEQNWSNYKEFKNSAQDLGIDVGYAAFLFGLSSSEASGSGILGQAKTKYCNMTDSEFSSDFLLRTSSTVADSALVAWSQCVQAYLASVQQGLFATVADGPDFSYFDIKFEFRTPGNQKLELTALNVENTGVTVQCKDGSVALDPTPEKPYILESMSSTIRCNKSTPDRTLSSINANAGTIFALTSYGQSPSAFERQQITDAINELNTRLAVLQGKLGNLHQATTSKSETITTMSNNNLVAITDVKNEPVAEQQTQKFRTCYG